MSCKVLTAKLNPHTTTTNDDDDDNDDRLVAYVVFALCFTTSLFTLLTRVQDLETRHAVSDFPSDSLSTRGFFSYFLACTVSFSGKNPICVLVVSPTHGIWAVNSFPLCFEHNFLEFS